jgi:uncharacterized OB-fold protein
MTDVSDVASLAPEPLPDPDSQGFWDATREGRLAISRCQVCGTFQHPPHERCRECGGAVAFEDVSGRGTIYSFIVVRQALVPADQVPYVIAQVELEEQPDVRVVGVVTGCEPEAVGVGRSVQVHFGELSRGGFRSPQWTLDPD